MKKYNSILKERYLNHLLSRSLFQGKMYIIIKKVPNFKILVKHSNKLSNLSKLLKHELFNKLK